MTIGAPPVFLEAVRGRQGFGVITQVVLAKLTSGVAKIEQEPRRRRGAGPQVGWAAWQLGRDQTVMPVKKALRPEVQLCMAT
jgi:hypothetical protein